MLETIKKLNGLLTASEHKHAGLLMCLFLMTAFVDALGVASIMPFLAVLANQQLVETNGLLSATYSLFKFTDPKVFLLSLGSIVFCLLVLSLILKALTSYAQLRFTLMQEYSIGKRLVEGYLHQPYSWFLNRNTAEMGKTILSEVNEVIYRALLPMLTVISQGAVVLALLALLIIVNPMLALVACVSLGVVYWLIYKVSANSVARMGSERLKANEDRFRALSEAFGALREVKVGGLEHSYIQRFATPAQVYACNQARASAISQLPRFAIEAIAFGGMLLLVLYLMVENSDVSSVLPLVALYAFAGYRLLPGLQQIYGGFSQLRFAGPAINALHKELTGMGSIRPAAPQNKLLLRNAITLDNVSFCYPNAANPALNKISLTIPAKSTVGLVGTSGSGKTTMVDLILGLFDAQQGTLQVDGQAITELNRRAWQQAIGYVPQQIYLADDSVAANIAFGLRGEAIDLVAVERAARIANLHDFVISDLPQGYLTNVGERGIRLSGGQRQRIGIARALYHDPQVLILDEATSALDNLTERAVMDAVNNLGESVTIILIAHRLSTVKGCSHIFLLERGELIGQGRFEELLQSDNRFRAMAVEHK